MRGIIARSNRTTRPPTVPRGTVVANGVVSILEASSVNAGYGRSVVFAQAVSRACRIAPLRHVRAGADQRRTAMRSPRRRPTCRSCIMSVSTRRTLKRPSRGTCASGRRPSARPSPAIRRCRATCCCSSTRSPAIHREPISSISGARIRRAPSGTSARASPRQRKTASSARASRFFRCTCRRPTSNRPSGARASRRTRERRRRRSSRRRRVPCRRETVDSVTSSDRTACSSS